MKRVLSISLIVIIFTFFIFLLKEHFFYTQPLIPIPDKMLLYFDENVIEINEECASFVSIYELNDFRIDKGFMETSIDEDTIIEIKNEIAIEYIYYLNNSVEVEKKERKFSKLLFVYLGWCEDQIIFFENGKYQSGTIKNKASSKEIKKIIMQLVK